MYFLAVRTESEDIVVKRVVRKLERYFANVEKIHSKLVMQAENDAAPALIEAPSPLAAPDPIVESAQAPIVAKPAPLISKTPIDTNLELAAIDSDFIIEIQKSPYLNTPAPKVTAATLTQVKPVLPTQESDYIQSEINLDAGPDLTAQQSNIKAHGPATDNTTKQTMAKSTVIEKNNTMELQKAKVVESPKDTIPNVPRRKNYVAANQIATDTFSLRSKESPQDSQIPQMREDFKNTNGLILGVRTGALVTILVVLVAAIALAILKNQKFIH